MPCKQDIIISDSYINTWLAEYKNANTLINYRSSAKKFSFWLSLQDKSILTVTRNDLLLFIQYLQSPPKHDLFKVQKPKPATIHNTVTSIRSLFAYLYNCGTIPKNPGHRKFNLPEVHYHYDDHYLTESEITYIQKYIDNLPDSSKKIQYDYLFNLFYMTGCRLSEISNANMSDIQIIRSGIWLAVTGKGGYFGRVPIPVPLYQKINIYREHHGLPQLFDRKNEEPTPLVMNYHNARACPVFIRLTIKNLMLEVAKKHRHLYKLKKVTPHWLRHTYASHLVALGVDYRIVQQNLRHQTFRTTERYIHVSKTHRHKITTKHFGTGK